MLNNKDEQIQSTSCLHHIIIIIIYSNHYNELIIFVLFIALPHDINLIYTSFKQSMFIIHNMLVLETCNERKASIIKGTMIRTNIENTFNRLLLKTHSGDVVHGKEEQR